MIKKFKYIALKDTYGNTQLGLKKGDPYKLIERRLSYIESRRSHTEKTCNTTSVYHYEYLINIPEVGCFILDNEQWSELIYHSEYIDMGCSEY